MKLAIVTMLMAFAVASISKADGFTCKTQEGDLLVQVYNRVTPTEGTRNVARMVLSDPRLEPGARTLAVFSSDDGTLRASTNHGAYLTYTGKVDLRFNNVQLGESVLGAAITDLATIKLHIYYSYGQDLAKGEEVQSLVDLAKRDGSHVYRSATCTRYLKGE